MIFKLFPGSMGLVSVAIDLLGVDAVRTGEWPGPVFVDATQDDVDSLIAIVLETSGVTIEALKHE